MSGILTPGERPGQWQTAGDHDRRIRALEAVPDCCPDTVVCVDFPSRVAEIAAEGVDLLGYWRLGETVTPWADTSGNAGGAANALETGSGTAFTPHVTGAVADDDDGAIQINQGKSLLAAEPSIPRRFNLVNVPMSVSAWVKPLTTARSFNAAVAGMWADAGFGNCGWALLLQQHSVNAPTLTFIRRESGSPAEVGSAGPVTVANDVWVFVVGTYEAGGTHTLYIDAAVAATDIDAGVIGMPTFNSGVQIGNGGTVFAGGGNAVLSAVLDEVTVWGDALTPDQVTDLYLSGLPCTASEGLAGQVLTADGAGGTVWAYPTIGVYEDGA